MLKVLIMDEDNNEIAAEWIVRAQLKIHNPRKKASSFGASDCCGSGEAKRSTDSPCRVVYNWHSDEKSQDRAGANSRHKNTTSEKVREEKCVRVPESTFRHTFRTVRKMRNYCFLSNPQPVVECDTTQPTSSGCHENDAACKSTCSITLTTDICPSLMDNNTGNGRNGCVTHTYTFSPDQVD